MRTAFLIAAALLPLTPALAQPPGPPPGAPDAAGMARHRADVERDLSVVLGLKPSQRPALDAWLATMAPPEGMMRHEGKGPGGDAATTPQRLQEKQDRLAERQRHEEAEIAATKRFYASLDSRQQQVFDALDRLRHEGHHGGPGAHGDHGPHGPGGHGPDGGPGSPPPPPMG